jgi:hypothetical protein
VVVVHPGCALLPLELCSQITFRLVLPLDFLWLSFGG